MNAERDALGRPVPPRLDIVFAGRRRLDWIRQKVERLQEDVESLGDKNGLEALDRNALRRALEIARQVITRAMPFTRCDCIAGDDCHKCRNRRWLTSAQYAAHTEPSQSP